ncbi:MAG: Stf0 family sulfotransferase [Candidatus Poribacteria bacterium]|nr:Stf0 family sulfotransferase [Candidatus Poribacteria bacterium]
MNYVICTTPRTRSTVLCDLLVSSNVAGYPREYHEGHESLKDLDITDPETYQKYVSVSTSPNAVCGIQVMHEKKHIVEKFVDFKKLKCIWLRRENKIKQAISLLKAIKRNRFYETDETQKNDGLNQIKITHDEIVHHTFKFTAEDMSWAHYFQENQISPLTIWYKDLETETQQKECLKKVLDFLSIDDTPNEPKVWAIRQDTDFDKECYNEIIGKFLHF